MRDLPVALMVLLTSSPRSAIASARRLDVSRYPAVTSSNVRHLLDNGRAVSKVVGVGETHLHHPRQVLAQRLEFLRDVVGLKFKLEVVLLARLSERAERIPGLAERAFQMRAACAIVPESCCVDSAIAFCVS